MLFSRAKKEIEVVQQVANGIANEAEDRARTGVVSNVQRRFSLTWRMIQMLLLCWVLPVVLVVLMWGSYLHYTLAEQCVERLDLSLQGATQLTTMRMDAAVVASRETSYMGTVRQAWSDYQANGDTVALFDTTRTFLGQHYQADEKFYSTILMFLEFEEQPIYVINGSVGGSDRVRQDAADIFAKAKKLSKTIDTSIAYFSVGERVFMVRNLVNSSYQPIAILMMELNTELIFNEFSQISNLEVALGMIDEVGISITPEHPPVEKGITHTERDLLVDPNGAQGINIMAHNDVMYSAVHVMQGDYDFSFYAISYPSVFHEQWQMTMLMLAIVILLMMPLGAVVFHFFATHVTQPIQCIIKTASKLENGKFGVQLPESVLQSQEIGALGDNFNRMSLTLHEQFEHIYKEEIALRDAKIMALQSQINPHFLNNTLEIINWEARMQGNLKVCNMLESLSTMLGAAMDRNSRRSVHLSEELMYVDAYLYIINERLGKRLVFEKNIPDEFLDVRVPRLVLQPILENAVEHGITPLQQGRIALTAEREGDWLLLAVENDGAMTEEDKAHVEQLLGITGNGEQLSSNSLGLRNVHQRLRILYGEEAGILVDTTKKGATVFKLKVKLS